MVKSPKTVLQQLQKKTRFIFAKIHQWWIVDTQNISKRLFLQSHLHCDSYVFILWLSTMTWHTRPSRWSTHHVLPPGPIWWLGWCFAVPRQRRICKACCDPSWRPCNPRGGAFWKRCSFGRGGCRKCLFDKGWSFEKNKFGKLIEKTKHGSFGGEGVRVQSFRGVVFSVWWEVGMCEIILLTFQTPAPFWGNLKLEGC